MADLPCNNWANKKGTSGRSCSCGSWKDHWLKNSGLNWPAACSVSGCLSKPVFIDWTLRTKSFKNAI